MRRNIQDSGIGFRQLSRNPWRAVTFAVLAGYAVAAVLAVSTHWYFDDAGAYWNAALRLRAGEPLYYAGAAGDPEVYRYAPWFAWLWVPLTYLPESLVMALWGAVLAAAALWLLWPQRSAPPSSGWGAVPHSRVSQYSPAAVALALLCFPDLFRTLSTGNVQPLLLAACAYGITAPLGPLILGAAASLKGWPLLFAGYWFRQPVRIVAAAAIAFLLSAPALLYNLSDYPTQRAVFTPGTLSVFLVIARVMRGQ